MSVGCKDEQVLLGSHMLLVGQLPLSKLTVDIYGVWPDLVERERLRVLSDLSTTEDMGEVRVIEDDRVRSTAKSKVLQTSS